MRIWRICKQQYAAFNGIGAERYGGRWNSPGRRVVYCASSLSLASLETFVHTEPGLLPQDLVSVVAQLDDDVSRQVITIPTLPENWRNYPAPEHLQQIGNQWLIANNSAVLVVPSSVIPVENNYLLNPLHPDFPRIRIIDTTPFAFDPRMLR